MIYIAPLLIPTTGNFVEVIKKVLVFMLVMLSVRFCNDLRGRSTIVKLVSHLMKHVTAR